MLKNKLIFSSATIISLLLLTLALFYIDVGYVNGKIGLFFINNFFATYSLNSSWDLVTNIILNVNFALIVAIVIIGVVQAIMRRSLVKICRNIIVSEILIVAMLVVTMLFSSVIYVNSSPVLQGGGEVSSYPSNHIVIVTFVALVCATLVKDYFVYVRFDNVNIIAKYLSFGVSVSIIALMFVGKILSGRVWFTDAISGLLLGLFFYSLFLLFKEKKHN